MLDKPDNRPQRSFPTPDWAPDRWQDIRRDYTFADVERLAGSLAVRHTLAERGARRLWELLHSEDFVPTLGTFTGTHRRFGPRLVMRPGWWASRSALHAATRLSLSHARCRPVYSRTRRTQRK